MEMTITDFARLGGKARWKGKSKAERSAQMQKLAQRPRKPHHKKTNRKTPLKKQATTPF